MGILGFIGKVFIFIVKVIIFPFKLIFGIRKKKEPRVETPLTSYPPAYTPSQPSPYPTDVSTENLKAKVDLMLTQVDSLKIEYETINQRIQNIERMVRELYTMAKS